VADSEITELCRRIYLRHRRAIDLITKHGRDRQAKVRSLLIELIESTPGLIPERHDPEYVRFALPAWDHSSVPHGQEWTPSGRMLLVQLDVFPDYLDLSIEIGPGDEDDRQRLLAQAHVPPFGPDFRVVESRGRRWTQIYGRRWLTESELAELDWGELAERIREEWAAFVGDDLPRLAPLMLDETAAAEGNR
jgi:hypothetical protein